jgi:hypothetical protein
MKQSTAVLLALLALIICVVGINQYTKSVVKDELSRANMAIDIQIKDQELALVEIADVTRQNGADEVTESIVVDCAPTERQRFDGLLNQLSTAISRTELMELDSLFFKCGSFFADRKAIMAVRLEREASIYTDYVALRTELIGTDERLSKRQVLWEQVAKDELALATEFNELVDLQREIIMTLLAGKDRNSPEISATLAKVNEVRNAMTIRVSQIENARQELRSL